MPSARVRGLAVATLAVALLTPGAAVAAAPVPDLPPGALPVVGPVQVRDQVRALLRRLPAVRATDVGAAGERGYAPVIARSGVVAGTGPGLVAYRWDGRVVTHFPGGPGTRTEAVAVNGPGQVVVHAWTDDGGPFPQLWNADGSVAALPLETGSGSVTALDDRGAAVGATTLLAPAPGSGGYTAVVWRDGRVHDLAPGGFDAVAWDVNERGHVVGLTHRAGGPDNTGWVWRNGVVTDLPTPPGFADTTADQVNDRGDVRGGIHIPDVSAGTHVGAVWFGGTDLRHLGANPGWLADLNEKGLAVGNLWRGDELFTADAATVDRRRVTRLLTTSGGPSAAAAVNDLGIVVGAERRAGRTQAVAWVLGVPVALGAPGGWSDVVASGATGVDEGGRAVGWVRLRSDGADAPARTVVWDVLRRTGRSRTSCRGAAETACCAARLRPPAARRGGDRGCGARALAALLSPPGGNVPIAPRSADASRRRAAAPQPRPARGET
ncbi:hypothetical protein [Cellulomonas telluris]|uniref:hypothetical protein n=1 Tax=Cellulomonas telluris TaxID=2306636 RepID=UPI0010A7507A|nr:hypothetical protein [Cellulomonas telluris]